MTGEILALAASDPAAFILRAADLREQRAEAATRGHWLSDGTNVYIEERSSRLIAVTGTVTRETDLADAEHIAAEANPAHALAAVRRWRGVVERHRPWHNAQHECQRDSDPYPCPDLTETIVEVRQYLGGAA